MERRLIYRRRRMKIHDKPSGQWMGKADTQDEAMVEEIELYGGGLSDNASKLTNNERSK